MIKSKKASFIFKLFIAVIGTFVLCNSAGVFRMNFRVSFLYYFTNISNLLLVAYFWGALYQAHKHPETAQKPWLPMVKHTLMLGITVTGLVAYFLLDHGEVFVNGVFNFNNFILHDVIPICAVLDLTIVILIVIFVVLGYLYVLIDKQLGKKIKQAEN